MSDVQQSIESIEKWLSDIELACVPRLTISIEEKKQLIATNRAIQELEKLSIPIPDELRNLKLKLSALDEPPEVESEPQITVEEFDAVVSSLNVLLLNAKIVRQKLSGKYRPRQPSSTAPKTSPRFYREYIISSLKSFGGRASSADVLEDVKRQVSDFLIPGDFEICQGRSQLRWNYNVQIERGYMVKEGLLKSDSETGIWELADRQ